MFRLLENEEMERRGEERRGEERVGCCNRGFV